MVLFDSLKCMCRWKDEMETIISDLDEYRCGTPINSQHTAIRWTERFLECINLSLVREYLESDWWRL